MGRIKEGKLKIELQSDLCAGSGYSYAGIVDSDSCYDEYGMPYIPARRIRGCMRETAETLLYSIYDEHKVEALFGYRGNDHSSDFVIGNAYVEEYYEVRSDLEKLSIPEITAQSILDRYSHVVGQTRIENGIADEGSLRYTRVINQYSPVDKGENINFLDNEYPPDLYNKRMNINIRTIDSAISNEKMLNVVYGDYHINKSLVPRRDDKYTVYPIKMILSMGRLYLYCRHEHHDNLSCMRVDRIISCTECEKGFNRAKEETRLLVSRVSEPHFAQRLYMFTGKAQKITFLTDEKHLNDVFDWFGKSVELKETDEGKISVTVMGNAVLPICDGDRSARSR